MGDIALIDYGSGNLRSAEKAVLRALRDRNLDRRVLVTSDADLVAGADHIILPGVGAFGDCMRGLQALDGMVDCLDDRVLRQGKPFLGICVGMQLMAQEGHEHGIHKGLGWLDGHIKPIAVPMGQDLKIPHMGWNQIEIAAAHQDHPVLDGLTQGDHMYFVHSYRFEETTEDQVIATTEYGQAIPAMMGRDNIFGTQFHPEKSQETGLRLMGNFVQWRP